MLLYLIYVYDIYICILYIYIIAFISFLSSLLKNFTKFTGKHLCWNLFLNKVPAWRPATLLKQKLLHMCFL